jgi:thioesterase domain-containing protein
MTLLADLPPLERARDPRVRPWPATSVARPLFLLPHYTGLGDGMAALATHLDRGGALHRLTCPLPPHALQRPTMEELALQQVETILGRQPEGPYRLAGWSFGGILAYEVAIQLVGRDRPVEFLGVIDATLPSSGIARQLANPDTTASPGAHLLGLLRIATKPQRAGDTRYQELRHLFAPDYAACRHALAEGTFERLSENAELDDVIDVCRRAGLWPETLARACKAEIVALLERWRGHDHALAHYAPFAMSTLVHLFKPHSATTGASRDAVSSAHTPVRSVPDIATSGIDSSDNTAHPWETVLRNGEYHFIPAASPHASFLAQSADTLARTIKRTLRAETRKRGGRSSATPEADYCPHIPVRQGGHRKEPVILIPGAGSAVTAFTPFCNALDDEWDIHGLQPRGFDGVLVPHSSVEAAAHVYIAQIDALTSVRSTPVHLVGHSFGGWIALDLACRLQSRGTPPASLTVIDAEAPESNGKPGRAYTFTEVSWNLVRALERETGKTLGIDRDAYFGAGRAQQWAMLHQGLRHAQLIHHRSNHNDLHGMIRTYATALRTVYRPPDCYRGPATLALAADEVDGNAGAPAGWKRLMPFMTVRQCAGNHYTLLQSPNVEVFAQWWQSRH